MHDVLGAQLAIAALVGAIAIVALAWTSGSVVRNNLEQWAGQWAEELNELGAPFYHDEREALLGVERFIGKFPEIDRVTWYRDDGSVLLSLGTAASSSDNAPALAIPSATTRTPRRPGVTPPFLLTENVDRPAVPIVRAGVDGVVHGRRAVRARSGGAEDVGRLARLRDHRARLLRLRAARCRPASRGRERRAAGAARRRLGVRARWCLRRSLAPLSNLQKPLAQLAAGDTEVEFPSLAAHRDLRAIVTALEDTIRALPTRAGHLLHLANHDPLTGLFNRHRLIAELEARDRGAAPTASGAARCSSSTSISSST